MRLWAAEGREAELAGVLQKLCDDMRGSTPGCSRSEASRSAHDPRRFLLLTCFADEVAYADHANSESYGEILPALMDCLEALPEIEIYQDL